MTITRTVIPLGDEVACDSCNCDCDGHVSTEPGEFVQFGSNGYCGPCSTRMRGLAKQYGEENHIRAQSVVGETFRQFIMRIRGGDNTITITSW